MKENDKFHITIYIHIIHNIFNIKKSSVLPWNEYLDYNAIHSKCTSNIYTLQGRRDNVLMFGTFLLGTWLIGVIWFFYELKTAPTVGEDDEFDYI